MRGVWQLHVARVRGQFQEIGHGARRHQVAAATADQQQRAAHGAGGRGDVVLVAMAVAGQFVDQAPVPVPAPAAIGGLPQQPAQRAAAGAAWAPVRQVGGDRFGGLFQRGETLGEGGHEGQDAFQPGRFPARGDVHQHHRPEQARPARLGQQAEQAAHRGGHQHRRARQFAGQHDQVVGELVAGVGIVVGIEARIAVATGVIGQAGMAVRGQDRSGRRPGPAGLAEAVGVQHRGTGIGARPAVVAAAGQRQAGTVQAQLGNRRGRVGDHIHTR